jgi:tripartite-type tricarboxylate transporter receptor subunit TctC
MRIVRAICVLLCIGFAALAGNALAQAWPAKPVKIIVPNAPGTLPDVVMRLFTDRLSRGLGTSVVIDNNTAGAGLVAAQAAARSAPDGYTFFVATVTSFAINPNLFTSLPYDPERDFAPAAMIYDAGSQVIAIHPDVPAKNLAELIALAKAQPGKLSYAADRGLASIVGEWLNKVAGTRIQLIPYKSPSQSLSDTAAGRTQMVIISVAAVEALRKSGKLRVLAVVSAKRFPALSDVPTVSETLPGFHAAGWSALVAPAGTPADILQRVNREMDLIAREPAVVQRLLEFGLTSNGAGTLRSIAEFMRSERERWGVIIREVGIKPE